ncbi:MAG: YsnF/AvaK domain-containing protein [Planctomycetes bacterium]|nr:YsnF/AvaK domain-containing protein [Planctomycetota bacterium]
MPNRKKHNAVVGVFETKARAEQAIEDLKAAGFDDDKIGMVYRGEDGNTVKTGAAEETYAEEGAVAGAVAGAAGGALVGAGIIAGVIPVVGPVLALGTLGTVLVNAAGGAAIAGVTGALIGWGIPEEDASFYENEVKSGRYLVTVEANGRAIEAREALHRRGGFDRAGWTAVRADRANTLAEGGFRDETGRVIQLKEERLRADKETSTGSVEVRKEVRTEEQQLTVPVEREEVVIERRPAGGPASGEMGAEEIRIPVKEERVKVTKEPVVREEVSVGKRKVRETRTVRGEVRKEDIMVEPKGGAKVRNTVKPKK